MVPGNLAATWVSDVVPREVFSVTVHFPYCTQALYSYISLYVLLDF